MEYIILCDDLRVKQLDVFAESSYKAAFAFSDAIDAGEFEPADIMVNVGALIPEYDDDSPFYGSKPEIITIKSANLLPPETQLYTKSRHWSNVVKRGSLAACAILFTVLAAETAAGLYFDSVKVSSELNEEYEKAVAESKVLDNEFETIRMAQKDDLDVIEAYNAIAGYRTEDFGFLDVRIGGVNLSAQNLQNDYAKISAMSLDEMTFSGFAANLSADGQFVNGKVNTIKDDNFGVKTAEITIGKAGK